MYAVMRRILLTAVARALEGNQKLYSEKNSTIPATLHFTLIIRMVVVGRWKKKNKKISFELFEDISTNDKKNIEATVKETFDDIQKTEWKMM